MKSIGLLMAASLLSSAALAQTPPPPPNGPANHQFQDRHGPPPPPPHRPPPPGPAAHFRFVHHADGTAMIDIKCADNEPTKACADAARELLRQIETMGHDGKSAAVAPASRPNGDVSKP